MITLTASKWMHPPPRAVQMQLIDRCIDNLEFTRMLRRGRGECFHPSPASFALE